MEIYTLVNTFNKLIIWKITYISRKLTILFYLNKLNFRARGIVWLWGKSNSKFSKLEDRAVKFLQNFAIPNILNEFLFVSKFFMHNNEIHETQ